MLNFSAHGKLLLTGEYLVMEGAQALALPIKKGQHMEVSVLPDSELVWQAYTPTGLWLSARYSLPDLTLITTSNPFLTEKLTQILKAAFHSDHFFPLKGGFQVVTHLDFDPEYGFGSSATLVSLLSQWLGFDAYELHHQLFGGSGYDIACAMANGPILYSIQNNVPNVVPVSFFPDFHRQLYFVYLGKKQRSSSEIDRFKRKAIFDDVDLQSINELTLQVFKSTDIKQFELNLRAHEALMSRILQRPTIQQERFGQYPGVVKSLGAWGGDFVLMTTLKEENAFRMEMQAYGYEVVYTFEELVISRSVDL